MLKKISFKYGKTDCPVQLADRAASLRIREPDDQINSETFIRDVFLALPADLSADAVISIVVADKTRLCDYQTYLPWLLSALEKNYKGNGGTALSMMAKTGRINIFLKTALNDKICRKIGVTKLEGNRMQEQVNEVITNTQMDIAWIENASLLIR